MRPARYRTADSLPGRRFAGPDSSEDARPICFRLFVHWSRRDASREAWTAGSNRPIKKLMMKTAAKSSINVNPRHRPRPRAFVMSRSLKSAFPPPEHDHRPHDQGKNRRPRIAGRLAQGTLGVSLTRHRSRRGGGPRKCPRPGKFAFGRLIRLQVLRPAETRFRVRFNQDDGLGEFELED